MKSTFFILILFCFFSLGMPVVAHAQSADLDISLSPPLTHIVIQPGKTALATVKLENKSVFDLNVTPNFFDFASDNESGVPVLSDTMSFPYIFLQDQNLQMNKPFVLRTGEEIQLLFEVNMPQEAFEKEYHFSLVAQVEPVQNILRQNSETSVMGQIASNFIVTVTTNPQDQGIIELHSFEGPLFVDSLSSIKTKTLVKNVGKNMTVTLGDYKIYNSFNQLVFETEILPENVLPNSSRELMGAELVTQDGEEFKIQRPFTYKPLFLLGAYRIVLNYHSPGQETQTFTHTVFALPISILIILVAAYILYLFYTKTNLFRLDSKKENAETE